MTVVGPTALDQFAGRPGTVHLVGAGPGDPGLLTVRAATLLATADVVLHDQLVTPDVIALIRLGASVVPVGRRCGEVVVTHAEAVDRMVAEARRGRVVVRLKGGDPTVFGRGGEEAIELLERGVDVALVPGVSSAIAAPELAGIPVTHRGVSRGMLAVTAHTREGINDTGWDAVAAFDGTVVVLMGRRLFGEVADRLVAAGRAGDEPAAAVAWAGTPQQQVVTATVGTIAAASDAAGLGSPAVLVVGAVVRLRERLGRAPSGRVVATTAHGESGRPG